MLHALAKNRDDRYQTAVEFRSDVDTAAAGRVPVHQKSTEFTVTLFGAPTAALSSSELALRQLTEDETMARTQRRPPAIWIWSGIIGVVVIVIAVMYWAFNLQPADDLPSNAREVPVLTGITYEAAVERLTAIGLPATRVDQTNETVPADQVIDTVPAAGDIVDTGTVITVHVSTGREAVTVPALAQHDPRRCEGRPRGRRPRLRPRDARVLPDRGRRHRAVDVARGAAPRSRWAPRSSSCSRTAWCCFPTSRGRHSQRHPIT